MPAHTPEEIHALIAAAFNARDVDAFAALHEPDATVRVPPDGQRVSGRDAIRAVVAPTMALASSFRSDVVGKLEADGLALTHARWTMIGIDGDDRVELSGLGSVVSRRQPDGSWRIALETPMSPE